MKSIFSGLPNDLIIKIVQIENDRKNEELMTKRKYREVIKHLNKVSTHDEFCPSIVDTFNRGGDGLSVSEIWGWDGMGVMDDLSWSESWLNELWLNEL